MNTHTHTHKKFVPGNIPLFLKANSDAALLSCWGRFEVKLTAESTITHDHSDYETAGGGPNSYTPHRTLSDVVHT